MGSVYAHKSILPVLCALLLAACALPVGPQPTASGQTPAPGGGTPGAPGGASTGEVPVLPTATATPFKPELVICAAGEPDRLLASNSPVARSLREALIPSAATFGADYLAEPGLLASLPTADDGTLIKHADGTITVTLRYRSGLVWSDGAPFTAADALLGLEVPASPFDPTFEVLDAFQVDDLALQVTVADGAEYPYVPPQPPLPSHVLGNADLSNPASLDYFRTVNPSLGPYVLTEWSPGSHILLSVHPAANPMPVIPVVRVRFVPDPAQIAAEMGSGCDVALADTSFAADQLSTLNEAQSQGRLRFFAASGNLTDQVVFNARPDPFSGVAYFADARVRQAFAQAIDRAAIAGQATGGLFTSPDSWLPPDHWAYPGAGSLPQIVTDPNAAASLLDAAGWTDQDGDGVREYHGAGGTMPCQIVPAEWQIEEGTPLAPALITTDDPTRRAAADQIAASLAAVGVRLQVQTQPAEILFASGGPLTRRAFDLALLAAVTRPDPGGVSRWVGADVFMHPLDHTAVHKWQLEERWTTSEQQVGRLAYDNTPSAANGYTGQNYGGWCSESADLVIVQASESVGLTERQSFYYQHQAIWAAELPTLPLYTWPRFAGAASYVCGIELGPYDVMTWNLASWFWEPSGACPGT